MTGKDNTMERIVALETNVTALKANDLDKETRMRFLEQTAAKMGGAIAILGLSVGYLVALYKH